MDLISVAAEIFSRKSGLSSSGFDTDAVAKGLEQVLPSRDGELDLLGLLAEIVERGGGYGRLADSWLSDDRNQPISGAQILSLFGQEKISAFAGGLGLTTVAAAQALGETLPEVIDRASLDGKLLDNMQVAGGKSFLGSLFS